MVWGILRISVTTLGAIVVLGIVAWPVALVMAGLGRRVRPGAAPPHGPGRGGREGILRRALPGHRRHRRHHRQPDHRALPGGRGPGEGPRRRAGRRLASARTSGPAASSPRRGSRWSRPWPSSTGPRSRSASCWRCTTSRRRGSVYLILFYATFVGTSLEESFEFIRLDVTRHRALRQVRRHRRHAARHRRPSRAHPTWWCRAAGWSSGACGSPTAPAPRSSRASTCASSPGEHVGLVGPSGSGKTTLTKLLLRFVDRDGGLIEIDGQDIACVTQQSLRRHIAYVPQDPQMLHRTIAENICLRHASSSHGVDMDLVRAVGPGRLRGRVRGAPPRRATRPSWASAA